MSFHKNPARPYAMPVNRKKYPPSVTTILDAFSIGDGLQWWAARLTAEFAVDQPQAWRDLDRDEAIRKLKFVHKVARDAAAARGTIVHTVNESWARGEAADVAALVHEAANRDKGAITVWQGREDFIAAEIERFVDALEKFWTDFTPQTVGIEEVVTRDNHPHSYIGQRDFTAELCGVDGVSLIDLKTLDDTNAPTPKEPYKGIHLEKYALQLSAYKCAPTIVRFAADGTELDRAPAYPIRSCFILALREDGTYQLVQVKAELDELANFSRLIDLWRYRKAAAKSQMVADLTPMFAVSPQEGSAA